MDWGHLFLLLWLPFWGFLLFWAMLCNDRTGELRKWIIEFVYDEVQTLDLYIKRRDLDYVDKKHAWYKELPSYQEMFKKLVFLRCKCKKDLVVGQFRQEFFWWLNQNKEANEEFALLCYRYYTRVSDSAPRKILAEIAKDVLRRHGLKEDYVFYGCGIIEVDGNPVTYNLGRTQEKDSGDVV